MRGEVWGMCEKYWGAHGRRRAAGFLSVRRCVWYSCTFHSLSKFSWQKGAHGLWFHTSLERKLAAPCSDAAGRKGTGTARQTLTTARDSRIRPTRHPADLQQSRSVVWGQEGPSPLQGVHCLPDGHPESDSAVPPQGTASKGGTRAIS